MKILITGAAGYIGGMLVDQFKEGPDVQIFALDIKNQTRESEHARVTWFVADLRKSDWFEILGGVKPDVVIHAAWAMTHNKFIVGAVFDYCVRNTIDKFIHLSDIDGYGTMFVSPCIENDPLRANDASGEEVINTEMAIKKLYGGSGKHTRTFILRLPTVFGPRAWAREHFFGTLGMFKGGGLPLFIANPSKLLFQILHEDDLVDVIGLLTFNKISESYEVYNVAPEDSVPASGLGATFGKRIISIPPSVQRLVPISNSPRLTRSTIVDSSKLLKKFKYKFNYSSYEALTTEEGRYSSGQN